MLILLEFVLNKRVKTGDDVIETSSIGNLILCIESKFMT